jgi:hypothetical protein
MLSWIILNSNMVKQRPPLIYSYVIPNDYGAAPNISHGVCTLAICKPKIRRVARPGDWVVATGSTKSGHEGKLIYAMEVTEVMPMKNYEENCRSKKWNAKFPDVSSRGDCIYTDFPDPWGPLPMQTKKITERQIFPRMLRSVHWSLDLDKKTANMIRDLSGNNVLISENFVHVGDNPKTFPSVELKKLIHRGRSHSNKSYTPLLAKWVKRLQSQTNNNQWKSIKRNTCSTLSNSSCV